MNTEIKAPSVTQEQIDKIIKDSEITVETVMEKITRVTCKLPNGWVLSEVTGAVSKENYDEEIGRDICMKKIESQIWQMEGYRLQANRSEADDSIPWTVDELAMAILKWGTEKGIIGINGKATVETQFEKLREEFEELEAGIASKDDEEIEDAIGDMFVVLILLADLQGTNIRPVLESVWKIISKRTGKMVDGVFVKD